LGLGVAAGWCLGVWLAVRAPHWPPAQAADWQFCAVAAAGLLAILRPASAAGRLAVGALFFAAFFTLLALRYLAGLWPAPAAIVWPGVLASAALLNVSALASVGRSVQAAATSFGVMAFSLVVSAALFLGGSVVLGHSAAILAAVAASTWLVFWILRRQIDGHPAALVVTTIAAGLLAQGVIFGDLPPTAALLFAAAWPAAAITAKILRHARGNVRVGFALAVLLGTCVAGLLLRGA
jgi:hypothetical protein